MKNVKKNIGLLFGAFVALALVSFTAVDSIEKPDRSIVIPPPAWKHKGGWDKDLTLFQIEHLTRIHPTAGIDESWVSWLQTSLIGLVLEPKTYDNKPDVMVAYGLLGEGNHFSDLTNTSEGDRSAIVAANVASGMTKEQAENAAPNYWQMLIGDKFNTTQKKDTFLNWCMEQSRTILWTLSKEEAKIYTAQMWATYDAINRPDWLEKEKAYYAELQQKDKVSQFTKHGYDGKSDGRKLTCFVYRRCMDGSTAPDEAAMYLKKSITFFEMEAAKH